MTTLPKPETTRSELTDEQLAIRKLAAVVFDLTREIMLSPHHSERQAVQFTIARLEAIAEVFRLTGPKT